MYLIAVPSYGEHAIRGQEHVADAIEAGDPDGADAASRASRPETTTQLE